MFLFNLFCLAVKFLCSPEKYAPEFSILWEKFFDFVFDSSLCNQYGYMENGNK